MKRIVVVAPLLAALVGFLALWAWGARLPDLEVRTFPGRTAIGNLRAASPAGEVFEVERDGLWRVDVAVAAPGDQTQSEIELVLRADGPEGAELRRARASSLERFDRSAWVRFEFEPLADSGGRRLHVQMQPAEGVESTWVAPWVRFRGVADLGARWGEQIFPGPRFEGTFLSLHPELRGVAFGGKELEGRSTLVLLDDNGGELRRSEVEMPARVEWGWLIFGFEPLADSRWKNLRFRLELPPQAHLVGTGNGPARVAYYGGGRVDERLGGLTHGAQRFDDRDLILRVWTRNGLGLVLQRVRERLGWRAPLAALCWLSASLFLAAALPRSRPG
jgi:hypothetical protein